MSFLIAVYVNEGIVLASDRRTTYNNTQVENGILIQKIGIHTNNSTDKTFICPNGVGISTCGDASLMGTPITRFIQDVIRNQITTDSTVESVPKTFIHYFTHLPEIPDTHFIVAGYENQTQKQKIYKVDIKNKSSTLVNTDSQGATWDGEITTLVRLIQDVAIKNEDGSYSALPFENILWNYFTLQDAVDFARYAVETTIQTMRFKNVVETVGGDVDILVITPQETKWLQKKQLF